MMVNERSVKEYISTVADVVHYFNSILLAQFMLNSFRNLTPSCYVFVTRKYIWDKLFFLIFSLPSSEELDTDMKRAFQALSGATRRFDACSTFNVIFVFKHGLLF